MANRLRVQASNADGIFLLREGIWYDWGLDLMRRSYLLNMHIAENESHCKHFLFEYVICQSSYKLLD